MTDGIKDVDGLPGDWLGKVRPDGAVWLYLPQGMSIQHRGTWDGTRVVWERNRRPYRKLADAVDRGVAFALSH